MYIDDISDIEIVRRVVYETVGRVFESHRARHSRSFSFHHRWHEFFKVFDQVLIPLKGFHLVAAGFQYG